MLIVVLLALHLLQIHFFSQLLDILHFDPQSSNLIIIKVHFLEVVKVQLNAWVNIWVNARIVGVVISLIIGLLWCILMAK